MEPVLVNTVSYFSVSAVMETLASGEVMKESFRQEKNRIRIDRRMRPGVFIAIKIVELFEINYMHSTGQLYSG